MYPWHWRLRAAVFAPEGAAEGGDGAEPAAPAPAADPAPPSVPNLFDALADSEPEPDANGRPQRPKDVPEQFWDSDKGQMRSDALMKSWRDLRARVSRGGAEPPPEKPDAYALPQVEGLPEGFLGGESDTLWPTIRDAAHKAGVSQRQLDALAKPFLSAVAEQMRAAAATDPEAAQEAERQAIDEELRKLGPNGKQFVRDVGGWLNGMQGNGIFTAEEVTALRQVSTAAGMRALGKLRELMGEKPIPTDAIQPEAATLSDLQRQMTEAYAKGDQGAIAKVRARLEEMERKGLLAA